MPLHIACKLIPALLILVLSLQPHDARAQAPGSSEDQFKRAWQAARSGDRPQFERLKNGLTDYVLYPYLQYEDYRNRRATADPAEVAAFLDAHADWAFTTSLRRSWLIELGRNKRWEALLAYAPGHPDAEVRCYLAQARIHRGQGDIALTDARELWAAGKSQPDACDPVFSWFRNAGGITAETAWSRVSLAMAARNPGLASYLARFLPADERVWVERWLQQDRQGYTRLDQARRWPRETQALDITAYGLRRLARSDADRAWRDFEKLDGTMQWPVDVRTAIVRDIALWSAVANDPQALSRMQAVPLEARDDELLEWWARSGLARANWAEVILAVAAMSEEVKSSGRWRYWDARARLQLGDPDYAMKLLAGLSAEASYYGFLAADYLGQPYTICSQDAGISPGQLAQFSQTPVLLRVNALQQVGLSNWSRAEWDLNLKRLTSGEQRLAAALAVENNWPDLAILALTAADNSRLYEWRFPLVYVAQVTEQARRHRLDAAWVMGLMRSESAMAEHAVSPANARGLMQVLPATAAQVAQRHSYPYRGSEQLMQADQNIMFGTAYLREMMDKFSDNQVLVSGAYNAGPGAVRRWLKDLPGTEAAVWIELLPYFETRDYIPRVLAFTTIYQWRMQLPVQRISSRMPAPDSGNISAVSGPGETTEVSCPDPYVAMLPGS